MPSAGQSSFNAQKQKSGIKRRSPMKGSSSNTGNKVLKYAGYANDVKSKQEDYRYEVPCVVPSLEQSGVAELH